MALAFSACKKDKGNYDYQDINEWGISNIQDSYSGLQGSVLNITPTITYTKDMSNDPSKYTYKWTNIDYGDGPLKERVIAETKDLNWTISNPSNNTTYKLLFEVTEKSTGLTFRKSTTLTVTSNISDGWLVLNDINGDARLDFFNYVNNDFAYYNDLLASFSTLKLNGKPKMLYFYQRRDPFSLVTARSIFVGTDQATFIIDTQDNTFSSFSNITNSMSNYVPPPYYAEKVRTQGRNMAYMLDSQGNLFFEFAANRSVFGTRVNRTSDGENITISPYFAVTYGLGATHVLMYDVVKKRFLENKLFSTASAVPSTKSTLFTPGDMNMDLMFMDNTPAFGGQNFAILKNSANKIYLARIVCTLSAFNPAAFDEVNAPEMLNATQFAIDPVSGYIMYVVGSKVYRYNPSDKANAMVLDLGARKVSLIKYNRFVYSNDARHVEYSRKLIVCSYDEANPATSGTMDLYTVPNLNGEISLYRSFTGLGKIVDVSYRE